ncbi:MAG: AAA family ATPase [Butyricimonas faecalis]
MSYAVASGGQIWGYQAIQSEVLYLGLEDTVTRLQSRFEMLEAYEGMENIHFVLKANSITSGVEEDIRDYLTQHPNIKLVVIDNSTYQREWFVRTSMLETWSLPTSCVR